ncbi:MAG: hypothetical protein R8M70_04015 [Alphaproteobacteria bacterium]|nr:hypothetical protein [Alphaproteobacteria bacterium]
MLNGLLVVDWAVRCLSFSDLIDDAIGADLQGGIGFDVGVKYTFWFKLKSPETGIFNFERND